MRGLDLRKHPGAVVGLGSALACAIYLAASGARASAPSLFLVACAINLGLCAWLLYRAGRALAGAPEGVTAAEAQLASGRRRRELEREKQLLLKALKELSFDHEMGKIADGDYQSIAAGYRARAIRVMRQLEEAGSDYRSLIDADLAARRSAPSPPAVAAAAPAPARLDCAACGADNQGDSTFCRKCGRALAEAPR